VKLTKSRQKENIEKEKEVEGKKKYQGKQQGEMVDDQRTYQTAKP
jgi:hypothetical protein